MALTIASPAEQVGCRCQGGTGEVCVKGSGATKLGVVATKLYVKIYQPPHGPDPEDVPPSGAPTVVPDANGDWCFDYVGGANCGTLTHLENSVWIWAEYDGPTYDVASQPFFGKCQDNLPECCASSSSSSSSS